MKFPGVRADNDMYTYGFSFNPWQGPIIGKGQDIKRYINDTAEKFNIKNIYYLIHRSHLHLGKIINGQQKLIVKILLANMLFSLLDHVIVKILIYQSLKTKINTKERLYILKPGEIQTTKIKM